MPSKAEEAKSRPPLMGWAMAPTTPFPTPLKKPAPQSPACYVILLLSVQQYYQVCYDSKRHADLIFGP